jgi:hypothetical protein
MIAATSRLRQIAPDIPLVSPDHKLCESQIGTGSAIAMFLCEEHVLHNGRGGLGWVHGNSRGVCPNSVDDCVGSRISENAWPKTMLQNSSRAGDARIARRYFTECDGAIYSRRTRSFEALGNQLPMLPTLWEVQGCAEGRSAVRVGHCATQNEGGMPYARSNSIALLSDGVRLRLASSLA